MRRIGICCSKGGVAKTTTAVNLAYGLARTGRVLLVDADTQGHCARLLGVKSEKGLAESIEGTSAADVLTQVRPNLWLLAGGQALGKSKNLIAREDFGRETVLTKALAPLENRFEYCVVDTSPGWDVITVNVLFFVNEVLCPVSLEALAVDGLGTFLQSVQPIIELRRKAGESMEITYILPTFYDRRVKKSDELMAQLEKHFGDRVCEPIRYSARLSEAPAWGKVIFEYAPKDQGAQDYAKLLGRIVA